MCIRQTADHEFAEHHCADLAERKYREFLSEKVRRHYAAKSKNQAARAPCGTSIEKQPKEIGKWEKSGHWEVDSIMGCKGFKKTLLVLTERLTRMGIVILPEDHMVKSVAKAINRLE